MNIDKSSSVLKAFGFLTKPSSQLPRPPTSGQSDSELYLPYVRYQHHRSA